MTPHLTDVLIDVMGLVKGDERLHFVKVLDPQALRWVEVCALRNVRYVSASFTVPLFRKRRPCSQTRLSSYYGNAS